MPYLTPSELPEDNTCRVLLIPDNYEWDAIVYGALSELAKDYNWEAYGAVTVAQAVTTTQAMLDGYAASSCSELGGGCELLDGSLTLRLGIGGSVEQWDGENWVEPTGDYEQPPIPPRTETTEDEKRCLAAANAVAVYAELYEVTTDAATSFEFLDEFLDAVFAGIDTWVGIWAGETAKSFAQLGAWAVSKFFYVWETITEDYWDEDFEVEFACILYNNATVNGDGSVSFDYDSVMSELQIFALNSFSLNYVSLWLQLEYLFYFAAGGDGLNAAGGTTAVEEYDCDDCEDTVWCYYFDFRENDGGWSPDDIPPEFGTWVSGEGWDSQDKVITITNPDQARRAVQIEIEFTPATTLTRFEVLYDYTGGTFSTPANPALQLIVNGSAVLSKASTAMSNGDDRNDWWDGSIADPESLLIVLRSSTDVTSPYAYSGACKITGVRVEGTGSNPFGDDNCPE